MIEQAFQKIFGAAPEAVVRAPGRVNLIGEHTDYNEGFVLPAAIDRYVWFAGRTRADRLVRAQAVDFGESTEFSLDAIAKDGARPWSNYLRGVATFLEASRHRLTGADLVFGGDVPREAGLSSSAAVEVGAVTFWQRLMRFPLHPVETIKLARQSENEFVGVPSGIMDQFVSALGRRDHALFLDCRDLKYRHVPLRDDVKIVVCNSGVKRALAHSEYEVRVAQCREAVEQLRQAGVEANSLRDVKLGDLIRHGNRLDPILLKRASHVVTENDRVREAVKVLEQGDLRYFGRLMNDSHRSLRDDYEVSSRELDVLVEIARRQPGVFGARMTGAGFGGCTVNLVERDAAEGFAKAIQEGYQQALGLHTEVYVCQASDGALAV
ncbi:MAG TPA: galactokinase [Terriglobia bacterium]|nr:galactokinase [Terriglobia bacterium]